MEKVSRKQGWFQIPMGLGPGEQERHGLFINGKLNAWAYVNGWHLQGESTWNESPSLEEAKKAAEKAVWDSPNGD